jgi:integrase
VSEVARVLPEHVDLSARVVLLEDTKTGKWQPRHITDELAIRIKNLPRTPGAPLFGYRSRYGIRHRAIAVCRRAKIPFIPSHQAGRHSFATNALAMGADPKQVMEAGGWKSARMVLEIYAHAENAGQIVAGLFDKNRSQSKPKMRQVIGRKGKK